MTERAHHPREALQELIDGRLDAGSRAGVESHVADCASCQREVDVLRATKRAASAFSSVGASGSAGGAEALDALKRRVIGVLDEEDRAQAEARAAKGEPRRRASAASPGRSASTKGPARSGSAQSAGAPGFLPSFIANHLRPIAAVGAAVLVLVFAIVVMLSRSADLPSSVAEGHGHARAGMLALDHKTGDTRALEAYFAENLAFKPHVFDLGAMRYRLIGGAVHRVAGRPSSLALYESPEGHILTCDMYVGRLSDLPRPTAERENGGVLFRVYEREGRALVFWQEGPIVCVLTGDIATEDLIKVALAKSVNT